RASEPTLIVPAEAGTVCGGGDFAVTTTPADTSSPSSMGRRRASTHASSRLGRRVYTWLSAACHGSFTASTTPERLGHPQRFAAQAFLLLGLLDGHGELHHAHVEGLSNLPNCGTRGRGLTQLHAGERAVVTPERNASASR